MSSNRSSRPAAASLHCGGTGLQPRRIVPSRDLPPLRVVPDSRTGVERPPTPGELVADVMALIDAGLVHAAVSGEVVGYAPVDSDAVVMNVRVIGPPLVMATDTVGIDATVGER